MTNEKSNGNDDDGSSSGAATNRPADRRPIVSATTSAQDTPQHPNGSIGGGYSDENNSLAECSASDDCGDKMAKESDPLQPKMIKSRSLNKVKVAAKEVRDNSVLFFFDHSFFIQFNFLQKFGFFFQFFLIK